jgi:Trm5-related predicted tRNA methylase
MTYWSKMAAVAAVSSLVTTWVMQTPLLHKKAEQLQTVKETVLPKLATQLAKKETALRQSECDKRIYAGVAVKGVVAAQNPNAAEPTWEDFKGCENVPPARVNVPKIPEVTQ